MTIHRLMKATIVVALISVLSLTGLVIWRSKGPGVTVSASPAFDAAATYAEFLSAPQDARTRFTALTPAQRKAVWRVKLQAIPTDDLTEAQFQFLKNVIQTLDQWRFDGKDDQAQIKTARQAAIELFGKNNAAAYFARMETIAALKIKFTATCPCSKFDDWCGDNYDCVGRGDACEHTDYGCGFLWLSSCDGICEWFPRPS